MVWNSTCPIGSLSVKANVPKQQENTTYTEVTLGNITSNAEPSPGPPIVRTVDHFWNIGEDEDGHHRQVQMKNYAANYTGAPTIPILNEAMGLSLFGLLNSSGTPAGTFVEPAAKNAGGIMQLLGIQAYAVWNFVPGGDPTPQTILKSFNVSSILLQSDARFFISFTTALPSLNYAAFVGGQSNSADSAFNPLYGSIPSGSSAGARMGVSNCLVIFRNSAGAAANPQRAWFLAFGG